MSLHARFLCVAFVLAAASGCYPESANTAKPKIGLKVKHRPDAGLAGTESDGPTDAGVLVHRDAGPECPPAKSVETIVARSSVMSLSGSPTADNRKSVEDLFADFNATCGRCHVGSHQGDFELGTGFRVLLYQGNKPASPVLPAELLQEMIDRIFSDDEDKVMPSDLTEHLPASERDPNTDPNLKVGANLKLWLAQGQPARSFLLPAAGGGGSRDSGTSTATYALTKAVGEALTNVGSCIPVADIFATDPDDGLDAFFAKATALPKQLKETDLTTFDSEELARRGIVAYAPTYPLWSDGARKVRHVRVPHGKSIQFVKDAPHGEEFAIPDNTRFYKTFLRKVIERDGTEHWRKIETRLIVARNAVKEADGTYTQKALFGTYEWDEPETTATLVDATVAPVRSVDPEKFSDILKTFVTDEAKLDTVLAAKPDGSVIEDISGAELVAGGAGRHYAIPGSERCIQCHMGSPSLSFVLGFTPLQINQRPKDVGGVIEDPQGDELSQLQRLIDYGIITGLESPSEVTLLEDSQPGRPPRNDYELKAQGYMVGNCAHCHNPNGFPSVQNPTTLKNFLDFLPGPEKQHGIFQFPLDKVSPRIFRDVGGTVKIPYITPSLADFPAVGDYNHTVEHDTAQASEYLPAWSVLAPWRSLIYRNVDTPFPYGTDLALFPHMPMNVPGFDCRLPQIMGDWMVSIPARNPAKDLESFAQSNLPDPATGLYLAGLGSVDIAEQPYQEVLKTDADFDAAKVEAAKRLDAYHTGGGNKLPGGKLLSRYDYCPDTSDIVDPTVTGSDIAHLVPSDVRVYELDGVTYRQPKDYKVSGAAGGNYDEGGGLIPTAAAVVWPDEGVPDRPHWVKTDSTEPKGDWAPRSTRWQQVLLKHDYPFDSGEFQYVVDTLSPLAVAPQDPAPQGVRLTPEFVAYATTEFPYGLWKDKPECDDKLAKKRLVSTYQGTERPLWMDVASPPTTAAVYTELPGAAVYNMVCVNCHGPEADSHGRQADTLNIMTGGKGRVANFRDGLFGPVENPGDNIQKQFTLKDAPSNGPTPEDWAARYMSWMALGGTEILIPRAILNVVATTPVLGVPRRIPGLDSANMLTPIVSMCQRVFGFGNQPVGGLRESDRPPPGEADFQTQWFPVPTDDWNNFPWRVSMSPAYNGVLMTQNGDAELIARLCSVNNRPPVRLLNFVDGNNPVTVEYVAAEDYPVNAVVGTHRSTVEVGVTASNLMPWCVVVNNDYVKKFRTPDGKPLPVCGQIDDTTQVSLAEKRRLDLVDARRWSYRGAINGGLAVFEYLKWLKIGKNSPVPPYDQCETLP